MLKRISKIISGQKGQTMLIVVLAIVIALTVGLSVVSRSITNLKTTTEDINSQKALAAAEAGVEKALQKLTSTSSVISETFESGANFSATVSAILGSSLLLNGGNSVEKDEGIDLWFVEHNESGDPQFTADKAWTGTINIYWGKTGDLCDQSESANTEAALEIAIIYNTDPVASAPAVIKYTADPCEARAAINSFDPAEDTTKVINQTNKDSQVIKSMTFKYAKTSISINRGYVARIIPIYASTAIGVEVGEGSPDLPSQGTIIESIGKSGSEGQKTERKVTVYQGYPSLPVEYFPNNFFYHSL